MIGKESHFESCPYREETVELRDDLDVDLAFVLHCSGFGDSAQGIGDSPLLTDNFAKITRGDAHFIRRGLFLCNLGNVHVLRLVHERFNQVLDQVFQRFLLQC